ncbi:kinase domain-containing protein [Podospora didyma]|uniref:non-specific serine/threonine protein kinase n=1 Tax=Podospora didyma TaxID=330526 RepID=A0AAE0N7B9_9PEZI|nr:kinase domain-containing protein [Podospora didyma]
MSPPAEKPVLQQIRDLLPRAASPSLVFPPAKFAVVDGSVLLEEERFELFGHGFFYPIKIGDVYDGRFQVLGNLALEPRRPSGWLATSSTEHTYVALKIFARDTRAGDDKMAENEFAMYEIVRKGKRSHPGYHHVPKALELFKLEGPGGGIHWCLVQKPMASRLLGESLLKGVIRHVLLALDYLHTECKLVHTDIKLDNILFKLPKQEGTATRVLDEFAQNEMKSPSPGKIVNGMPVYRTRLLGAVRDTGRTVLSDLGAAVPGDVKRTEQAQPDIYRAPEIWDMVEGRHLFKGHDPERNGYSTHAHLAEVVALLGPPPLDLLKKGRRSRDFFTADGQWQAGIEIPDMTLENSIKEIGGEKKASLLAFVKGMLQWRPEDRKTAAQLLEGPWLIGEYGIARR